MTHRTQTLGLLIALGLLVAVPACSAPLDDDLTEDETAASESGLAKSGAFQNGVSPASSYAGAIDTTLREATPTTNDGAGASVSADADNPPGTRKRVNGLLRFDLRTIPAGSKVTSVSLTLNVTNRTTGAGYSLFTLLRSWSESQATWNAAASGSGWSTAGARGAGDRNGTAIASLTPTVTGKVKVTFNAAGLAAVQSWINDPAKNFGFVIDTPDNADGLVFDSSNASTPGNRPQLSVNYDAPAPAPQPSPYPIFTKAEVDGWSTSNPQYTRLANSWAGKVNRTYAAYGPEISSVERDVLKDEAVYIKTQAVLWAADNDPARKAKVEALLADLRPVTSWQWDSVEQYRLVAGWVSTNLAQAAAIVGYRDPQFIRFLTEVNYPIMDWVGSNNWNASFADSKLAIAVYTGNAALYADAKAYFYKRIAQSTYHSAYDGNKVVPLLRADGTPDAKATVSTWGGYWGTPQVKSDFTFVNPSYVVDGFNVETIRDLGHVSMGLGAWMHGARTIVAHGDKLEKHAYDRLRAAYALHASRVLAYKNTGTIPAPTTVKGDGGGAMNQSYFGARRFFGGDTPAAVVALCNHPDVIGYPAAGANHLVAEAFADQ